MVLASHEDNVYFNKKIFMENKDIIKEIVKRYNEALNNNSKSFDYGVTKKERTIFIEIDKSEYSVTRQALSDKPDGVGDDMANKILNWIQS